MGVFLPNRGPPYNEPLQSPSLDECLYLFLQVKTIVCVMTVILVKATVLVTISILWWAPDSLEPFDAQVILEV